MSSADSFSLTLARARARAQARARAHGPSRPSPRSRLATTQACCPRRCCECPPAEAAAAQRDAARAHRGRRDLAAAGADAWPAAARRLDAAATRGAAQGVLAALRRRARAARPSSPAARRRESGRSRSAPCSYRTRSNTTAPPRRPTSPPPQPPRRPPPTPPPAPTTRGPALSEWTLRALRRLRSTVRRWRTRSRRSARAAAGGAQGRAAAVAEQPHLARILRPMLGLPRKSARPTRSRTRRRKRRSRRRSCRPTAASAEGRRGRGGADGQPATAHRGPLSDAIREDTLDARRARPPFTKFVRDYIMRQYGMRSLADKAIADLRVSALKCRSAVGMPSWWLQIGTTGYQAPCLATKGARGGCIEGRGCPPNCRLPPRLTTQVLERVEPRHLEATKIGEPMQPALPRAGVFCSLCGFSHQAEQWGERKGAFFFALLQALIPTDSMKELLQTSSCTCRSTRRAPRSTSSSSMRPCGVSCREAARKRQAAAGDRRAGGLGRLRRRRLRATSCGRGDARAAAAIRQRH